MRRRLLRSLALMGLLVAGVVGVAWGEPVLEPPLPGLGDRAILRLETALPDSLAPVGIGVVVMPTPTLLEWTVVPVRVGTVGLAFPGSTDTLRWDIAGQIAEAAPDSLRPLKSTAPIRPNWWPTVLVLLTVLLAIFWLVRRFRPKAPRAAAAFALVADPPHRVALERLAQIESSGWLEAGEFDRYFVAASHALREYIAGRYRVPALDWTSGELEACLLRAGYRRGDIAPVKPLLQGADRVKFGAERPTVHLAQQWLESARSWIAHTAVEPQFTTTESVAAAAAITQGSRAA